MEQLHVADLESRLNNVEVDLNILEKVPNLLIYFKNREQLRRMESEYAMNPGRGKEVAYKKLFRQTQGLGIDPAVADEYERLLNVRRSLSIELKSQ